MSGFPTVLALHSSVLVGLLVVFFIIPYLPRDLLLVTDLLLVRLVLLAGLFALACANPVLGIAGFIVVAMLFIERNKTKMIYLQASMQQSTPESPAIAAIVTPSTAPPQPVFTTATQGSIPFSPDEESGDNSFFPVAPSINQKKPLPTETSKGSDKAIRQLFMGVNTSLMEQV